MIACLPAAKNHNPMSSRIRPVWPMAKGLVGLAARPTGEAAEDLGAPLPHPIRDQMAQEWAHTLDT